MRVDEFDFELPADRIALRPVNPRDSAKMLVVTPGQALQHSVVADLVRFLKPGDALVLNDTKVIPAQLEGIRLPRSAEFPPAKISATLHMRIGANIWDAFIRPAKKIKIGDQLLFAKDGASLPATVTKKGDAGEVQLVFSLNAAELDAALFAVGHIPLPPYIASKRAEDSQDKADYQTIYARQDGAVAAPTAGLHFTDELLASLSAAGIAHHFVTLHVGAGTFLPVKAQDTDDHVMHFETGTVSDGVAAALNSFPIGGHHFTEALVDKFKLDQQICQRFRIGFRIVDILMTNFHLPRSTLMMLVSAFSGLEIMRDAYRDAIANGYRFYSYGDASLLFRQDRT